MLFFVTLISIPFASFFLSPNLLENFSQSVISICFFLSNILFWLTTGGYFDLIAELKPLIHTWSLSVEIQFYILFPFIVMLLFDKKNNFLLFGLIIMSIFSLIFGYNSNEFKFKNLELILLNEKSLGSFYLIFSRAWELFLGGIASIILILKLPILSKRGMNGLVEAIPSINFLLLIFLSIVKAYLQSS